MEYKDLPIFSLKNDYLKLSTKYLENSGLKSDKDITLYSRQMVKDLYNFLFNDVIKDSKLGWILGCPGTGKSISTFSMLKNMIEVGWEIRWFHVYRNEPPTCILLSKEGEFYQYLEYEDIKDMILSLNEKNTIVFFDGYVNSNSKHNDILSSFNRWIKIHKSNRLVVICSMSSRGKTSEDEDFMLKVKCFFFEYQNAITDEVSDNLDAKVLIILMTL
jgi:hypothetical protein